MVCRPRGYPAVSCDSGGLSLGLALSWISRADHHTSHSVAYSKHGVHTSVGILSDSIGQRVGQSPSALLC